MALGRPATASAYFSNPSHPPENVTDGSVDEENIDFWLLPSHTTGWVQVDLEKIYDLHKIRWLNTHNRHFNDRAATEWRLAISIDGVNFEEIASGTEEFSTQPEWVEIEGSFAVRFIRLYVDDYYGSGGGINEIEAYGTEKNLALGRPAAASDYISNPSHSPENVTDGSVSEENIDFWLLPSYRTGWVEVDLEDIYDLHKLRWLNTHNRHFNDRATTDWRLAVSADGVSFDEIASGTEEFSTQPEWVEIEGSFTARHIRFYVDGYYDRGGGVNEIEAYGRLSNPAATNVALGRPASASDFFPDPPHPPENVTDGSVGEKDIDFWLLPSHTTGWVQVDLESIHDLREIHWLNTHNRRFNDRATAEWRLAVSVNGVDFEEIASGNEEFSATPEFVRIEGSFTARYIRLYVDGYHGKGGGANEIRAYGKEKNVALGQAATASESLSPSFGPERVVDGSTDEVEIDYWLLPDGTTGWVQVELDAQHQLARIRWLNTHNGEDYDRAATEWRLAISADGLGFQEIASGTEEFSPEPEWVTVEVPEEADAARFIRLYVDGYYGLGGGVNEIEAYSRLASPGATNLALGKPAVASAYFSSPAHPPENVTDGSVSEKKRDFWLLPSHTTGWVEVDLEEVYSLSEIRWLNTRNRSFHDRATTDWRISVSPNGTNYIEVASGTEEFSPTPAWVPVVLEEGVEARYIRFHVDGYYHRGGGINEIEVYGE